MTLEQLPPKGVKREQAILELGKDEANGELLFQLVKAERDRLFCRRGGQRLFQISVSPEYARAFRGIHSPLWTWLI